MSVLDWPFLLIAAAIVVLLRATPLRHRRVETLATSGLLYATCIGSAGDTLCLLAMAATGWAGLRALARHQGGLRLGVAIAAVVLEFLLTRQVLPLAEAPPWLAVGRSIGLSYVMFRVIHMLVDAQGEELPPALRLRDYIACLFNPLTFLAGPIQRVQDFVDQVADPVRTAFPAAVSRGVPLIVGGLLQFAVLAAACFASFAWSRQPGLPPAFGLAAGWLSFAGYLYFSFAGYTDVVRGIGVLIDLDLPENFARPFAAANFLDVWARWHISLSEWFKLYVFNPSVKAMIARCERPALIPYLGAAGYFLAFFLMGVWHGVSLRFVLYGLCLGAGVSVNKLYQVALLRRLGRQRVNALARRPLYVAAARAAAVAFFILALGFLWITDPAIGPAAWLGGGAIVLASVLAASFAAPPVARVLMPLTTRAGPRTTVALCTLQAAVVLAYLVILRGPVPPLLYTFF